MHANSVRAGYLDLDGCTVVDLLPRWEYLDLACLFCLYLYSNFIPTCSECSTLYPAPGIVSVRGESSMTFCRECHRKMSMSNVQAALERVIEYIRIDMIYFRLGFKVPEVKFLQVSAAAGMFPVFLEYVQYPSKSVIRAMMLKPAGYFPLTFEQWQCEQIVLQSERR